MRDIDTTPKILRDVIRSLESYQVVQSLNDSSVQSKITYSSSNFDMYIRQTATREYWRLTAKTASGASALIDMNYWYRQGNSNVMANPQQPTTTAPIVSVRHLPLPPVTQGELSFDFALFSNLAGYPPPHDVYLKFLFKSTDDVTWTMTKL